MPVRWVSLGCDRCFELPIIVALFESKQVPFEFVGIDHDHASINWCKDFYRHVTDAKFVCTDAALTYDFSNFHRFNEALMHEGVSVDSGFDWITLSHPNLISLRSNDPDCFF